MPPLASSVLPGHTTYMAKLYITYFTMNAGKSTSLLQASHNYRERGMQTYLMTAKMDTRAGKGKIASRIGIEENSDTFSPQEDLFEKIKIKLKKDKEIKKVVICSGKIYFDLLEGREKVKNDRVFFIRIEQLYPFPVKTLAQVLKRFRKNAKFYWCQEEPQNMGAWNSARNYIEWTLNHIRAENRKVNYIGREPAASPATGYLKKHLAQQKEIIEKVFKQ